MGRLDVEQVLSQISCLWNELQSMWSNIMTIDIGPHAEQFANTAGDQEDLFSVDVDWVTF
jgi:hypothetical protein